MVRSDPSLLNREVLRSHYFFSFMSTSPFDYKLDIIITVLYTFKLGSIGSLKSLPETAKLHLNYFESNFK